MEFNADIEEDKPEDLLKNDVLGMQTYAEKLAKFIIEYDKEDSLTININGVLGSGKTTFINFVKNIISSQKNICMIKIPNLDLKEACPLIYQVFSIFLFILDCFLKCILLFILSFFYFPLLINIILIGFIFVLPIKQILFLLFKPYSLIYKSIVINKKMFTIFKNSLEKKYSYILFDFSPWSYENVDSLIFNFLNELKKNCLYTNSNLVHYLSNYQSIIKDKSLSISLFLEFLKDMEQNNDNDLNSIKKQINQILIRSNIKIIITIDDIDRLTKKEVLNICKLLKSIANFKNTIYLLPFDRNKVSQMLEDECSGGIDYLDKITNFNFDLRKPNQEILKDFLLKKLEDIANKNNKKLLAKREQENEKLKEDFLNNFRLNYSQNYEKLFKNKFQTIRQVKRYLNQTKFLYIQEEVNIYDFLNLTAIEYFYPNIYNLIYENKKILCKQYPLFYILEDIYHSVLRLINKVSDKYSEKDKNVIVINLNNETLSLNDMLIKIKFNFEKLRLALLNETSEYDKQVWFVENNVVNHIKYLLTIIREDNINLISNELCKLKEHIERENQNLKIVLSEFYQLEKDKRSFEEFIDKCEFRVEKKDAFISFIINLFPNLNILYNKKYLLSNANLYLFRFNEDSLRDRRICNEKIFINYFEYNKYPITINKINNTFNLRIKNFNNEAYLQIYSNLHDLYSENYSDFCKIIEDGIVYETSSFFGAGCEIFKGPFKEYIKALILAYNLMSQKYSKYDKEFKEHPEHKLIIKNSILRMVDYINNPSVSRIMFIEALNELISQTDSIQNIKNIDCLFDFLYDIQKIKNEYEKYSNRFDITKEDLDRIKQNAVRRLEQIIPTNGIINDFIDLPNFLKKYYPIIGEDVLYRIFNQIEHLNNSNMSFIKRYPRTGDNNTKKIFVLENDEFVDLYGLLVYWQRKTSL